ncbi:ATP-binding cassette domain-containing protein [Micromonospora sp. WMMD710]|uniref:ATP-binding cassette domain-containing protein n=1 Tax=Micromonospora sp. WMMD710 TaxID=3016085 RepID=UPI002415B535|nr:ATP-binding cassette domain-containing protein [Micromonospora sp. WMMD710]MDG4759532.1 ATP-binding cassette domain-containing protein [Micromonospora sp. WMMD710]
MVVVEARGLGLRTSRGWVFRGVDLAVNAGELHTIVGVPGSGRTSLLLALADRFPTSEGRVERHAVAALGQVAGVHEPDPELTVAEHVAERLLLLGRRADRSGPSALRPVTTSASAGAGLPDAAGSEPEQGSSSGEVAARPAGRRGLPRQGWRAGRQGALAAVIEDAGLGTDVPLDPASRARDLTPVQRQILGLVLATLSGPGLILADDVDAGTDGADRALLRAILGRLTDRGIAVVVTAREAEMTSPSIVHRLGRAPTAAAPAAAAPAASEPGADDPPHGSDPDDEVAAGAAANHHAEVNR